MNRDRWLIAAAIVLFLVARAFIVPTHIQFKTLTDASTSIKAAGFHCRSDRADGIIQSGFLVSQNEVTWQEVNELNKIGKLGAEWKGKVWVTSNGAFGDVGTLPEDGCKRVWGDVWAFGDEKFLVLLEGVLQSQGPGNM